MLLKLLTLYWFNKIQKGTEHQMDKFCLLPLITALVQILNIYMEIIIFLSMQTLLPDSWKHGSL